MKKASPIIRQKPIWKLDLKSEEEEKPIRRSLRRKDFVWTSFYRKRNPGGKNNIWCMYDFPFSPTTLFHHPQILTNNTSLRLRCCSWFEFARKYFNETFFFSKFELWFHICHLLTSIETIIVQNMDVALHPTRGHRSLQNASRCSFF